MLIKMITNVDNVCRAQITELGCMPIIEPIISIDVKAVLVVIALWLSIFVNIYLLYKHFKNKKK